MKQTRITIVDHINANDQTVIENEDSGRLINYEGSQIRQSECVLKSLL